MVIEIDHEILADLHVISLTEYEDLVFGMSSACIYVCMYV
jgi:hypothetical protein